MARRRDVELVPERIGGREHDLLSRSGEWLKFTKPWAAGYVVDLSGNVPSLLPARPLQYIQRLRLQNRFFGDAIRFIGISGDCKNRRLITAQPDIIGRPPTWSEIDEWFARNGFIKLGLATLGGYDAAAFAGHGLGVFDVRPANVILSSQTTLIPIDLMLRRLTKQQSKHLCGMPCK